MMARLWTLGQAARELGVPDARLLRLYRTGRLPEPGRCGNLRCLTADDLERAREALAGAVESRSRGARG
jgi:hypothetical protein